MRKIHLEPMIKQPKAPSRNMLVLLTVVLSIVFAASVTMAVVRMIEYADHIRAEGRV